MFLINGCRFAINDVRYTESGSLKSNRKGLTVYHWFVAAKAHNRLNREKSAIYLKNLNVCICQLQDLMIIY